VRRASAWLVLGAATAALGWALGHAGVPSSYLFAALLLGLVVALGRPGRIEVPDGAFAAAQAVTGVALGTFLQSSALRSIGDSWAAVAAVSAATLVVSIASGLALARATSLDRPTAALGMIAGGASGIVAMARDLGADDRLVAFMQYARVLVVVFLTPLLIALAFGVRDAGPVASGHEPVLGDVTGWLFTAAVAVAGSLIAAWARVPAPTMLGPMILAGALTLSGATTSITVPPLLQESAFAVIGLQVGLGFTIHTVRQVGRLLLPVLLTVLGLMVACFALAAALAAVTPVTLLDAYLATTPGGLYAVLAVAVGAGANTTFIVAVQGLRVLVMVLLAPVAVRLLVGRPETVLR
jgi:membrane AbrB-like protein